MPVKAINFTLFIPTLVTTNVSCCTASRRDRSRRDAVLINRLCIGHTRLTHSYLLSGDDQPVCSACQSPFTVKNFLIECVNFAAIRSRYFSASSMKDVFESINAQNVIDFIKEINFHHEL